MQLPPFSEDLPRRNPLAPFARGKALDILHESGVRQHDLPRYLCRLCNQLLFPDPWVPLLGHIHSPLSVSTGGGCCQAGRFAS